MSYVCLKRDLKDGEYGVFEAMGVSYIAKSEKEKVTLSKNACSHRGFRVAECAGKGPIRCPYHGQRFTFDRSLKHYEFGEFIFAPDYLGGSTTLSGLPLGEEFGSHEQTVMAPFHLWMQNTADPNHLTHAHKDSFSKLFDGSRPENVYISEYESSYMMRIKDEVVERYKKHFPDCSDHFFHYIAFPNLSVTSFLNVFYSIETANPASKQTSLVKTRFFMGKGLKTGLLSKTALEANKKILKEDSDLVEKWALNYQYDPTTKWLTGEERIKRYADEIRARGLE
jgi:phenylpropionate dioxygenase-like ring-hydroxylating dioxygenase large terminal subunit